MNINDEARRKLTEFLGECWHEYPPRAVPPGMNKAGWDLCVKCRHHSHYPDAERRTFSTPNDMVALTKRMAEKGVWGQFFSVSLQYWWEDDTDRIHFSEDYDTAFTRYLLINPERFCWLVSEYLRKVEGGKL